MKLHTWLIQPGNSQASLARGMSAIGRRITQGAISQWKQDDGTYLVPLDRVLQVEAATDKQVTRHEMHPEHYPREEYAA